MNPVVARLFNEDAGAKWSALHRSAATRAKRQTGFKGKIGARVWEKQKRGLAHVHGVISVASPAEVAWAEAYVGALREMSPRYGFGFVDGWHKISRKFWPGDQAGAYLSSYFMSGRGAKASITENVQTGDLPHLVVYVGRHLTRVTGCTMRNLRGARQLWAWRQGLIDKLPLEGVDLAAAAQLLDQRSTRPRAP